MELGLGVLQVRLDHLQDFCLNSIHHLVQDYFWLNNFG
jgi:hypothetical protein